MGILKCACGAEAEGKSFEEADDKIDHSIALSQPGPGCAGDPTRMTWDEKGKRTKDGLVVKKPIKCASQESVMLVGKEAKSEDDSGADKTIASLKDKLAQVGGELKETKAKLKEAENELKKPAESSGDKDPKSS